MCRLPVAIWTKEEADKYHAADESVKDAWDAYAEKEAKAVNDASFGPDRNTSTLHQWAPPLTFTQRLQTNQEG